MFFALLETAYGGEITETTLNVSNRKNTSVEWRFHRQISEFLLTELQDAMSILATFKMELLKDAREASNAQRIHTNRFGHVVTDVFEVEVSGITGVIKIEYPAVLIKRGHGRGPDQQCSKDSSGAIERLAGSGSAFGNRHNSHEQYVDE